MGGVLLAATACDKNNDTTTTTATTSAAAATSAAATSAAPASGTAPKEQCDKAKAVVSTAFTTLLGSVSAAGNDTTKLQAAVTKFVADLQTASTGIDDPALKAALADWIKAVSAKAATVKS